MYRRLKFVLKNNEILWNVYYTLKFFIMLWGKEKGPQEEQYAFEHKWRPLDLKIDSELRHYPVPQAKGAASRKSVLKEGKPKPAKSKTVYSAFPESAT